MKWFRELRKGQKVLFLTNVVLIIGLIVLVLFGIGDVRFFALGIVIGFINLFSIAFAKRGFQFGIMLNTENAGDDVQPSEIKYTDWYLNWGFYTLVVIGTVICGLLFR